MKKRAIGFLLALSMIFALTACGEGASSTPTPSASGTPTAPSTPGTPAESAEPTKIIVGMVSNATVGDYYNNYLTQYLEETCNVELEFVFFSSDTTEAKTQLAAMFTADEQLPDVIYGLPLSEVERYNYGKDGYLLDLREYWEDEELTAAFRQRMGELYGDAQFDSYLAQLASVDGGIYGFGAYAASATDGAWNMMFINQVWLDRLGLDMPTTMDEFVEVLRAFKTRDPNGNGKADEIPVIGTNVSYNDGFVANWIINNYCYLQEDFWFNVENGQLYLPHTTDEYRKGLQMLRDLVDEGLVPEQVWTMSELSDLKAIWTPADGTAIAGVCNGQLRSGTTTDSPVALEYTGLLPLKGAYAPLRPAKANIQWFITEDAADPLACFKLFLAFCTEEGSMATNYGKEGVDWHWVEDPTNPTGWGIESLNPNVNSAGQTSHYGAPKFVMTRYSSATKYNTVVPADPAERTWSQNTLTRHKEYVADYTELAGTRNPDEVIDFVLKCTEAELDQIGTSDVDVQSYLKEARAQFAGGQLDPYSDADWNAYLKTVESLGVADWTKASQTAYDRLTGK